MTSGEGFGSIEFEQRCLAAISYRESALIGAPTRAA
jgi:hypothetical protein